MRKPPSKYEYNTDAFMIKNTGDIRLRLNKNYSDPKGWEVVSTSIFQNGGNTCALIVSRRLRDTNQK